MCTREGDRGGAMQAKLGVVNVSSRVGRIHVLKRRQPLRGAASVPPAQARDPLRKVAQATL
jgi:hypothetical protein